MKRNIYKLYHCSNMFCKKPNLFEGIITSAEGVNGKLPDGWARVSNHERLYHPNNETAIICDYCVKKEELA